MTSVDRRAALVPYTMAGLALILLFFAARVVSVSIDERRSIRESASNRLLYDAEILARNLDGLLRIADALLSEESANLLHLPPRRAAGALAGIASRLPESQNVYLLDKSGSVLATAWPRQGQRLGLTESQVARLMAVGGAQTLIVDAPAEGGTVLAIVRALQDGGQPRLAAVLFSSSVLEGRIGLLKESGEGMAAIVDLSGTTLVQRELTARAGGTGAASGGPAPQLLSVETALRNYPLLVRIRRDIGPAVAAWRNRLIWQVGLEIALLLVLAAMSMIAFHARRRTKVISELERRLEAEELLFHEINHRTKNNLSIVQSILSLGADEAEEHPERAPAIIRSASERVQSMSLLHEQLYRRRSLERVDFGIYLADLTAALGESYDAGDRIAVEVHAAEKNMLDLGTAVPLGLIVTEFVTNAFKHAFPDGRRGRIDVEAGTTSSGRFAVAVSDDGVGSAAAADDRGFGHVLVEALAAQLGASLAYSAGAEGRGTCCRIECAPAA